MVNIADILKESEQTLPITREPAYIYVQNRPGFQNSQMTPSFGMTLQQEPSNYDQPAVWVEKTSTPTKHG